MKFPAETFVNNLRPILSGIWKRDNCFVSLCKAVFAFAFEWVCEASRAEPTTAIHDHLLGQMR